jgi:hypothetical protein
MGSQKRFGLVISDHHRRHCPLHLKMPRKSIGLPSRHDELNNPRGCFIYSYGRIHVNKIRQMKSIWLRLTGFFYLYYLKKASIKLKLRGGGRALVYYSKTIRDVRCYLVNYHADFFSDACHSGLTV